MYKKSFITISFLFLFVSQIFASAETDFSLFIEPEFFVSFEKNGEYILYDSMEPISYLNWQTFPILKTGMQAGLTINQFSFSTELLAGIPMECGRMLDSDWNEVGLNYIYSENQVRLISNFSVLLKADYDFIVGKSIFAPSFIFQYEEKSMKAHDGHGWYGNSAYSKSKTDVAWNNENATYFSHIGGSSSYIIHNFFTFIGCTWKIKLAQKSVFGVGTYISPYSYTYTKDFHYRKSGTLSKYVYAQQHSVFYRFKEDLFFSFKLSDEIDFVSELSAILGGKAYGEYKFYQESTFEKEKYYLGSKGTSASDIYSVTSKIGISFKF